MLRELKIDDKTYPVDFGLWTIRRFCEFRNIQLSEFDKRLISLGSDAGMSIQALDDIAYYCLFALETGARRLGNSSNFTIELIYDMIGDGKLTIMNIADAIVKSMPSTFKQPSDTGQQDPQTPQH